MKSTIKKLLLLPILFLSLSSTGLPKGIEDSSDTQKWTEKDIQLMADLIPILYKEVLRLDSCVADGKVLDSINVKLNEIISSYETSEKIKDEIISNLNAQINQLGYMIKLKDDEVVATRKKYFWRGFGYGALSGFGIIIVMTLLL